MDKKLILLGAFLILFSSCATIKTPPLGVNFEGPLRDAKNVDFHYDLTYLDKDGNIKYDRNIWQSTYDIVDNAKDYLIVEMFLFNDIYNKNTELFPEFAKEYTARVIKKKRENPNLKIYVLSDENNDLYGSFEHPFITAMKNEGIDVITVDIYKLKDTFPWYSPIWRSVIKPFGNPQNKGWIPNFYGSMWPKLTLRTLFRALNVKADHRKVFLNENDAVIASANIHDPSYFHENVALHTDGDVTKDILSDLQMVANFSNSEINVSENSSTGSLNTPNENILKSKEKTNDNTMEGIKKELEEVEVKRNIPLVNEDTEVRRIEEKKTKLVEKNIDSNIKNDSTEKIDEDRENNYKIQYVTEGAIGKTLDADLKSLKAGDEVLMGMYFLADKPVIDELIKAANRGVKVRIIFDRSRDAFGMSTNGLPNKPVSKKLKKKTKGKIEVKWYFTNNEQYHTKVILMKKTDGSVIVTTGSANMIRKNIRGYIMDANLRVETNENSKLTKEIYTYFDRLWENKDGLFTINFDDEPTTSAKSDFMYKLLDAAQLGSF